VKGGHNLKPAEVRLREGNPGKRPVPRPAVIGDRAAPRMPAGLSAPAKTVWQQVVPELVEAGVVRTVDAVALEAFVVQVAVMRQAQRELKHAPLLVNGSRGQPVRNPLLDVLTTAQAEVRKWCERFGLDPSTRTRLGLMAVRGRTLEQELDSKLGPVVDARS